MSLGKTIRLNRLFSHPSGRFCSVAVDHFIGYQTGLPAGLTNLPQTLERLVLGHPDAVTMMKGVAKGCWGPHAGRLPLIISSIIFTADDRTIQQIATPEEALRMGADAIAVAIGVRGPNEGKFLKILTDAVEQADRFEIPLVAHVYPRAFDGNGARIVPDPENIEWAVRCGIEAGADVVKTPYTGDPDSFRQIVDACPVPIVAAGGPKTETLEESLRMMTGVVASGARGATIGRNVWGAADPTAALMAFKAVIHDRMSVEESVERSAEHAALALAGRNGW